MSKTSLFRTVIVFLVSVVQINAQIALDEKTTQLVDSAKQLEETFMTNEAIGIYKLAIQQNPSNQELHIKVADLFFDELENYSEALSYYEGALKITNDTSEAIAKNLGLCYLYNENYAKAILFLKKFNISINPNSKSEKENVVVKKALEDCNYALKYNTIKNDVIVANIGSNINSSNSEFSPIYCKKDSMFIFASNRHFKKNNKQPFSSKHFEEIFYSKKNPSSYTIPKGIIFSEHSPYKQFNEGNSNKYLVTLSENEDTLYLYSEEKMWRLIRGVKYNWKKPTIVDYYGRMVTYFTFSEKTKTKVLSIDNTTYMGDKDIYYQFKNDRITAFPDYINTTNEEACPFITADGQTVYFSSNGLPGYGGFDIYKTTLKDGKWSNPENLGLPINSSGNDMYYRESLDGKLIYFTSDRKGSLGESDIYQIIKSNK